MSIQYVSQDEIEAHEAAMQRVVEDERNEREENDKKNEMYSKADRQDLVYDKSDKDQLMSNDVKENKVAAMQRDFERLPLLRQVYHEAPDDVFELIVSKCSDVNKDRWGRGGLNAFRLANKRLKQVVESCTTRLTNGQREDEPDLLPISAIRLGEDGPELLPVPIFQRCRRIVEIRCDSRNLRSLEGCPDGLKRLLTLNAPNLSDLSPLASCSMMGSLEILYSSVTDISVVSSMPLLKTFVCPKGYGMPSIKNLSPLSSCSMLKKLSLQGNRELKDLSPVSSCKGLETLDIRHCPLITSLAPLSACTALQTLDISYCPLITSLNPLSACTTLEILIISGCSLITSLAPLSAFMDLKDLQCSNINPKASFLPLASCTELRVLICSPNEVDLKELRRRRPELTIINQ